MTLTIAKTRANVVKGYCNCQETAIVLASRLIQTYSS